MGSGPEKADGDPSKLNKNLLQTPRDCGQRLPVTPSKIKYKNPENGTAPQNRTKVLMINQKKNKFLPIQVEGDNLLFNQKKKILSNKTYRDETLWNQEEERRNALLSTRRSFRMLLNQKEKLLNVNFKINKSFANEINTYLKCNVKDVYIHLLHDIYCI